MSWRRFADAVVEALPAGSFDVVVTGDEVHHGKPHPEPYRRQRARSASPPRTASRSKTRRPASARAVAAGCTVYAIPNVVDVPHRAAATPSSTRCASSTSPRWAPASRVRPPPQQRWPTIAALVAAIADRGRRRCSPPARRDGRAAPAAGHPDRRAGRRTGRSTWRRRSVAAHGTWLRDVSPFWFTATGATVDRRRRQPRRRAPAPSSSSPHARQGATLIPSIFDGMAPGAMARCSPTRCSAPPHVTHHRRLRHRAAATTASTSTTSRSRSSTAAASWATTRPNWVAFVTELAAAAARRRQDVDGQRARRSSTPSATATAATGCTTTRRWVASSTASGSWPTTTRPASRARSPRSATCARAIAAAKAAVDDDSKLVLGVALHGYNWPLTTDGTCPDGHRDGAYRRQPGEHRRPAGQARSDAGARPETGEASFTYRRRSRTRPTSCTQTREVHYVDAEGARERIDLARTAGLGGVSLWALGYDSPATWSQIGTLAAPANGVPTTAATTAAVATTAATTAAVATTAAPRPPLRRRLLPPRRRRRHRRRLPLRRART